MKKTLRIVSRKSPLAIWQAQFVRDLLLQDNPDLHIDIIGMTTLGDQMLDSPLAKLGGKGLFVKELEQALLNDEADIAVHSLKDVGVHFPAGLGIHAILPRHSPFDAFVSNRYTTIESLPEGAVIGTCSLRRVAQLSHRFPHLHFQPLRGNVNTRLAKLDNDEFDGIILAVAGLERLNLSERIQQILPADLSLPAIAQGALGIECRDDNSALLALLNPLIDDDTSLCVKAERAVNEVLNGSCQTPIAAFATIQAEMLELTALVGEVDGSRLLFSEISGPKWDAHLLGVEAGKHLLEQGAGDILNRLSATE